MAYVRDVRSDQGSDSEILDWRELGQRIKLVAANNPYMADDLPALQAMAMSPLRTEDLVTNASQMYAMQVSDGMAQRLRGLSPSAQRAITGRLSTSQQQALASMGYQPPGRDEGSILGTAAGYVAKPLSVISRGIGELPGVGPAFGFAWDGLTWTANKPGQLYRTMRTQDEGTQWAALAGGLIGAAAVVAAPFTAGTSLAALGAIGLGATAGGVAASYGFSATRGQFDSSPLTNPNDWGRAFNAAKDGERVFERDAQRKAEEILGDPRMVGAAEDLAVLGIDVVEFAHEMAGHREVDRNSQLRQIEEMAAGMATPGSKAYTDAITSMTNVMADKTFQQAVQELNNGKISPGRDIAGLVPFIEHDSLAYSVISGMTDAVYTLAVDPFLMFGAASKIHKARVNTISTAMFTGADAASQARALISSRPQLMRNYNALAEAVRMGGSGGVQRLRQNAPHLTRMYGDMVTYRQSLIDNGQLRNVDIQGSDVLEYMLGEAKFKPLLEGIGSVRNSRGGIQITSTSWSKEKFRQFRGDVRAIVDGMADISTEARFAEIVKVAGKRGAGSATVMDNMLESINLELGRIAKRLGIEFEQVIPDQLDDLINEDGLIAKPWQLLNELNSKAYSAGRALGEIPLLGRPVAKLGEVMTSMTTMSITGKAFHIAGPEAVNEIRALSELGRYMGMPSYYRRAWADVILSAPSPAARMDAVNGWMVNMMRMTGIDSTPEGEAILNQYIKGERKLYGAGDEILANGYKIHDGIYFNEQADMMIMPDLAEMRKAALSGHISKLMGIADLPVVEASINKVWKPAVLLRIGFIPRAAGEELAAFMLRDGFGSLTQQIGSRNIANWRTYQALMGRKAAAEANGTVGHFVKSLTKNEQALLNAGRTAALPAHIRPVARMFERSGWRDPAYDKFEQYARFLERNLSQGTKNSERVDRALGAFAGHNMDDLDRRLLEAGADVKNMRVLDKVREAQRRGILPLRASAQRRMNVASNVDTIFLGNPYSVRRMILGGVHGDIVEGGMQWAKIHSTTMMREASARNQGPMAQQYDPTATYKTYKKDEKTGELRPVLMLRVKGERMTIANGDPYFVKAFDEELARPMADPAFRLALNEHMVRVLSPNVTQEQMEEAARRTHNLGMNDEDMVGQPGSKAIGYHGRNLLRELIGPEFKRDQWDVMLTEMANTETGGPFAEAIRTYIGQFEEPTIDSVLGALKDYRATLIAEYEDQVVAFKELKKARRKGEAFSPHDLPHTTLESKAYYESLNRANQLINGLETNVLPTIKWARSLPFEDQHYIAQFTHQQIVGGRDSFWAKHIRLQEEKAAQGPLITVWDDPIFQQVDDIATRLKAGKKVSFGKVNQNRIRKAIDKLSKEQLRFHEQDTLTEALRYLDAGTLDPTTDFQARMVFRQLDDMIERHKTVRPEGLGPAKAPKSPDVTRTVTDEGKLSIGKHAVKSIERFKANMANPPEWRQFSPEAELFHSHAKTAAWHAVKNPKITEEQKAVVNEIRLWKGEGFMDYTDPEVRAKLDTVQSLLDPEDFRGLPTTRTVVEPGAPYQGLVTGNEKWTYDTLDEAYEAMVGYSKAKVLDPNVHDIGATYSLRPLQRDPEGQFVETEFRDATVVLYDAPRFPAVSYDQILANSTDRELVSAHREVIEGILRGDPEDTALLANQALATELHRVNARLAGVDVEVIPHSLRMPRKIMDGRKWDSLAPDAMTKVGDETQLWHMPTEIAQTKLTPTPDGLTDPAEQWARMQVENFFGLIRRGDQQQVRPKMRAGEPLADGTPTEMPLVYEWIDGQHVPIQKDEIIELARRDRLVDHRGSPIVYGDTNYFTGMEKESMDQGRPMWEILGPRMRDLQNDVYNATRWEQKPMTAQISKGAHSHPIQSNDSVPLRIASTVDIDRVDANDLPRNAISELLSDVEVGKFDQMVQFGFDWIIGPSIDAVIRRPMAYNAFIQRYISNKKAQSWLLDKELVGATSAVMRSYGAVHHNVAINPKELAKMTRAIVSYNGDKNALKWTTDEAMAWLRGHSQDEIADMLVRTITRSDGLAAVEARAANVYARQLAKQDFDKVRAALQTGTSPEAFITTIEAALPEGALRSLNALKSKEARAAIEANPLLKYIDDNQHWDTIYAMHKNLEHIKTSAGELAAIAAIADVVPFLDTHEVKTQFADYGKGFLPFWYAEENFMKRWARGLAQEGPAMIRKAQLTYMGLKTAGVVRTDENGKDWFVYPGSGLLAGAIERMPGMSGLQAMGMMFQTPTDQMFPGLNNRMGAPAFNPLVTMSMEFIVKKFPELAPMERAVLGDFASGQGITDMVVPAHFRNIYKAFANDEREGNARFGSAMMAAMAYLDAHDQGLPDNATPGQTEDYYDRIRKHARIIVLVQAIGGFFVPGAPSPIATGDANLTGIGQDDPGEYLNSQYIQLVQTLGIEEGTAKFLEMNKDASIDDIVNPLAYTVPKNESVSGAPIPSTMEALEFYDDNADYMNEFPNAAPWLLPQSKTQTDRSQYAYDQLTADGLRKRRTPEEFFRAMKFKGAAQEYFATRDAYGKEIDKANLAGDLELARALADKRDYEQLVYRMAHPIFAEELQSSDGRAQRARTLKELRYIVDDPAHPNTENFEAIKTAVHLFDRYKTKLAVLGNDRSADGVAAVEHLKEQYTTVMGQLVDQTPTLMSLWVSVLRPESSLD